MSWWESVNKAKKDYTEVTGKVIDENDLNDLNDYLKIVFDAYEFYGFDPIDLEDICEQLNLFFLEQDDFALNNMGNDDYEAAFPNKNLNFALGLIILDVFWSSTTACNFTKDDLPTVRVCLDTPYEKRKEAEEKIELYFWHKGTSYAEGPNLFFMKFFNLIYELLENSEENLIVYSHKSNHDDKKNIELKADIKKLFDIVTNAKLVKKAIPYGKIYEAFSQDDKWLFTVINEIGNNINEYGNRIYDCNILTNDVELREFLESFLDIQVGVCSEKFYGCEAYVYGNMNANNGAKVYTNENLLSKNSEVFASIRNIYLNKDSIVEE